MFTDLTKISGRLRALYPKANLSSARITEITGRLSKLIADDADDTAIDAVINQANDFNPFADIAKNDDVIRNLEAKVKNPKGDDPNPDPKNDPLPDDLSPAMKTFFENQNKLIAGLVEKVSGFEQNQTQKSLSERFTTHPDLKNIPKGILNLGIPKTEAEFDAAVESMKQIATENKLNVLGNDSPGGQPTPPAGTGKVDPDLVKFATTANEAAKNEK